MALDLQRRCGAETTHRAPICDSLTVTKELMTRGNFNNFRLHLDVSSHQHPLTTYPDSNAILSSPDVSRTSPVWENPPFFMLQRLAWNTSQAQSRRFLVFLWHPIIHWGWGLGEDIGAPEPFSFLPLLSGTPDHNWARHWWGPLWFRGQSVSTVSSRVS